jgi:hypothetical protein
MFGAALLDSLLLVIAAGALGVAAFRVASTLGSGGLPRLLAAVVLAAAMAVLEALALGCFGLGGSALGLTLLAVASALAAWRLCPAPVLGPVEELAATLGRAGPLGLIGFGAVAGAVIALATIVLHRPLLGQDAITYHLADVVGWIQSGHTGRVQDEFYGLPVGNYPVTEEVLLAWATGISHGFSAALVLTVATVPLLLAAGWLGLGELGVPRPVRVLALAALALVPLVVQAWVQPGTDLEALTWLICCAALCLAARRHPGLLVAAVVAAGLAVGTKTTVLSYAVGMLAATAWFRRAELRPRWRSLAGALALATATGLIWYLRNWIEHGSPLWPFSSFPGGDPRPATIDYLSTSLLDSLRPTLLGHLHGYVSGISGGVALILLGILATLPGLALRRRRLLAAGLVVLAGTLEYSLGPVTGLPPREDILVAVVGSTLRYLMPVFAAGSVALAVTAADDNPWLAGVGVLALAGATVWDLVSDIQGAFFLPFDDWLWPGIALGAGLVPALAWALARVTDPDRTRHAGLGLGTYRLTPGHAGLGLGTHRFTRGHAGLGLGAAGLGIVTALVLAVGAIHFSHRHALVPDYAQDVSAFLLTQPGYLDTNVAVATTRTALAPLAGDRLQHPLSVIPRHASCATVDALHERDWIVVGLPEPTAVLRVIPAGVSPAGTAPGCLIRDGAGPRYQDGQFAVFAPLQN